MNNESADKEAKIQFFPSAIFYCPITIFSFTKALMDSAKIIDLMIIEEKVITVLNIKLMKSIQPTAIAATK